MLNRAILIGRLTRDPELKYTANGNAVCTFTVAVNRPYTNQAGERQADFIDIVAWNKLAEIVAEYMTKGRLVAVEGRIQTRTYENQEGQKRKVVEVIADLVRFLDKVSSNQSSADDAWGNLGQEVELDGVDTIEDDEIPF